MADIINLRRARKSRDRALAAAEASANRALHGQTNAQKAAVKLEAERLAKIIDGAKRDDQP